MSLIIDPYRFASVFSPVTSISWRNVYWADDPSWTNPGDGNAVASWRDAGTDSKDVVQATAGFKPLFRSASATMNSKGAVDFDTSDDDLAVVPTTLNQPFSVVWIGSLGTVTGTKTALRLVDPFAGNYTELYYGSGTAFKAYANASLDSGGSAVATSTAYAVRAKFNGASSAINQNGTGATGTLSTGSVTYIGMSGKGGDGQSGGLRSFVGIYNGDVTADGQWAAFVTWVSTYYGLTIA